MVEWSVSNTSRQRRSLYRGVNPAPTPQGASGRHTYRYRLLSFSTKPEPAVFLMYTDDEVEAATRVDSALSEKVGL